jgi:hypothetical protein
MLYEYDKHSKRAAEWQREAMLYRDEKLLKVAGDCQQQAAYWYLRAYEARDIYIELTKGIEVKIIY